MSVADAETYALCKRLRLCPGCKGEPAEGKVYCRPCVQRLTALRLRTSAKWQRKTRRGRIRAGQCGYCDSTDMASDTMCAKHLAYHRARGRKARQRAGAPTTKCSRCKTPGHNARTCPLRGRDVPGIEFFAQLRPGV